jgi:phosphocarrier protein
MGLHARPAAHLVQTLQRFQSQVRFRRDEQEVDGKSIMGLLTLTAEFGAPITAIADGPDEQQVIEALTDFFENKIMEDDAL